MKTVARLICAAGVTLAIGGCQTMTSHDDRPARIVNPDDASRAALQSLVSSVLKTEVTLSDHALTDSNLLSIERDPPRTMQNPNPVGRIMEAPIQFRLMSNGSKCILIDQRDQSRYTLDNTSCEAE